MGQDADPVQLPHKGVDGPGAAKGGQHRRPVPVKEGPAAAALQAQPLLQQLAEGRGEHLPAVPGPLDAGQGHRPGIPCKVQLQPGSPLLCLLRGDPPLQQLGVEELPQHRQALLVPAAQELQVLPLGALGVQPLPEPFQHGGKLRGADGLQDVLKDVHLDGLLGVLKIIKAGKDHKPGRRQPPGEDAAKLQPVQKGHFNVGEDHVGGEGLGQLQGLLAVFGLPHQGEAQALPVHLPADSHPDVLLVVHQQHPVPFHNLPSLQYDKFSPEKQDRGAHF